MISEDRLQQIRQRVENSIDNSERLLADDAVPEDRLPYVYMSNATRYEKLGVIKLISGETDAARDAFHQSAAWALEQITEARRQRGSIEKSYWENEPIVLRDAFYAAILSRRDDTQTKVFEAIEEIDDSYPTEFPEMEPFYHYVKALRSLSLDSDSANAILTRLEDSLDLLDSNLQTQYESLATALRGINEGDSEMVRAGLDGELRRHKQQVGTTPEEERTTDDIVCFHALAVLHISKRAGLSVSINSKYILESALE